MLLCSPKTEKRQDIIPTEDKGPVWTAIPISQPRFFKCPRISLFKNRAGLLTDGFAARRLLGKTNGILTCGYPNTVMTVASDLNRLPFSSEFLQTPCLGTVKFVSIIQNVKRFVNLGKNEDVMEPIKGKIILDKNHADLSDDSHAAVLGRKKKRQIKANRRSVGPDRRSLL